MLKELQLFNWKSFDNSTLYIDPLTMVIGTNASGKSNILDALSFLSMLSKGYRISDAIESVRGGKDWILRKGEKAFTLIAVVEIGAADYKYKISIQKHGLGFEIKEESLTYNRENVTRQYFYTNSANPGSPTIDTRFYTAKRGSAKRLDLGRSTTVLSQLDSIITLREIKEAGLKVAKTLSNIFILNPIPNNMRQYSPLSVQLKDDASNIAGVLAGMEPTRKDVVEQTLTKYLRPLPEKDIKRVFVETVGKFNSDAMLYCDEEWTQGFVTTLDARGMSDGTLRFIAIITAILTSSPDSLLVVEEIDNGLHPSRSQELVDMLTTLGKEYQVDVLCTTHNPELVDKFGIEMIPCICYVKRDENNGCSRIEQLEDRKDLPKLMAGNSVGDLMKGGLL